MNKPSLFMLLIKPYIAVGFAVGGKYRPHFIFAAQVGDDFFSYIFVGVEQSDFFGFIEYCHLVRFVVVSVIFQLQLCARLQLSEIEVRGFAVLADDFDIVVLIFYFAAVGGFGQQAGVPVIQAIADEHQESAEQPEEKHLRQIGADDDDGVQHTQKPVDEKKNAQNSDESFHIVPPRYLSDKF